MGTELKGDADNVMRTAPVPITLLHFPGFTPRWESAPKNKPIQIHQFPHTQHSGFPIQSSLYWRTAFIVLEKSTQASILLIWWSGGSDLVDLLIQYEKGDSDFKIKLEEEDNIEKMEQSSL